MARPRYARVAFAQIAHSVLGSSDAGSALEGSIVPGTAIERYDRLWRMGRVARSHRKLVGRIGYERAGEVAELWDPELADFKEQRLKEGLTSPFALDLGTLRIAFQLRAGRIRPTSFTGAFQALLNEVAVEPSWRVHTLVDGETFAEWSEHVRRVKRLEIRLERPNPHYGGHDYVERIIEGTHAQLAKLILEASGEEVAGLNLDDDLIRQAIAHALDGDYGTVKAVGEEVVQGQLRETEWRSEVEGSPEQTKAPIDPETREVPADELGRALDETDRSSA